MTSGDPRSIVDRVNLMRCHLRIYPWHAVRLEGAAGDMEIVADERCDAAVVAFYPSVLTRSKNDERPDHPPFAKYAFGPHNLVAVKVPKRHIADHLLASVETATRRSGSGSTAASARTWRMEIIVALQEWLGKIPDFSLVPDSVVEWSAGPVRGPRTLPLVFGADQRVLQG
jgi:hypothetical protein